MLAIVGGTYREVCINPHWDQLYGSGLRAAIACSEIVSPSEIALHTWISRSDSSELACRAKTYGVSLCQYERKDSIEFRYEHPLSVPVIYPWQDHVVSQPSSPIHTQNALIFGVLEATVTIKAERLVYDPQAGERVTPLLPKRYQADAICIVANLTEAMCLAKTQAIDYGDTTPPTDRLGRDIFKKIARANDVIIIKNGSRGATVITASAVAQIPSYRTNLVFKIGSGDVFSAVFAALWAEKRIDAVEAAHIASRSVAYYCNSSSLPIPKNIDVLTVDFQANPILENDIKSVKVYLAGPLFNVPERWFVNETKRCLESCGLNVFSPLHDVGTGGKATELATKDLVGLDDCDLVFAILDGLDAGTIFEIGYATARGKLVIAYGERVCPSDLTMLEGTGTKVFTDYCTAIYQAAWHALAL